MPLSRDTAIVGIGQTEFSKHSGRSELQPFSVWYDNWLSLMKLLRNAARSKTVRASDGLDWRLFTRFRSWTSADS